MIFNQIRLSVTSANYPYNLWPTLYGVKSFDGFEIKIKPPINPAIVMAGLTKTINPAIVMAGLTDNCVN